MAQQFRNGPSRIDPQRDPADGNVVEPGAVWPSAEADQRLHGERKNRCRGQAEQDDARLALAVPRIGALLFLREEQEVAYAAALLIVLAFTGGVIWGYSLSERQRDQRLRETLSRLDTLGGEDEGGTNITIRAGSRAPLSVTVIQ